MPEFEPYTNHQPTVFDPVRQEAVYEAADLNVRSEEVQEIIGRPPHWLIRWGVTVFFAVFLLVLLSGWVIRYPESIDAPLTINAINAPQTLESRIAGRLVQIIPENHEYVEQGQVLAWMESTADHQSVLMLSDLADQMREWLAAGDLGHFHQLDLSGMTGLGEIQNQFQTFEQAWREFYSFLDGGIYQRQRQMLVEELGLIQRQLEMLEEQKEIHQADYEFAVREFDIQQELASRDLVAPIDLARAERDFAAQRLPLQQTESAIINNQVSQVAKENEIMEMDRRINEQQSVFFQSLAALRSTIDTWKATYLLTAPFDGRVIYAGVIRQNQTLMAGQEVFYIQPDDTDYFATLELSQESVGKIEQGQMVLVRLSGYPYHEFGTIEGRIDYLSEFPLQEGGFLGRVMFSDGFVTSYGREVQPRNGMTGEAEIITEDMTLLQRVYNNMTRDLR